MVSSDHVNQARYHIWYGSHFFFKPARIAPGRPGGGPGVARLPGFQALPSSAHQIVIKPHGTQASVRPASSVGGMIAQLKTMDTAAKMWKYPDPRVSLADTHHRSTHPWPLVDTYSLQSLVERQKISRDHGSCAPESAGDHVHGKLPSHHFGNKKIIERWIKSLVTIYRAGVYAIDSYWLYFFDCQHLIVLNNHILI